MVWQGFSYNRPCPMPAQGSALAAVARRPRAFVRGQDFCCLLICGYHPDMKTDALLSLPAGPELPDRWHAQASAQLAPGETLLGWMEVDLNTQLRFTAGVILLTDRRLLSQPAEQAAWHSWPLQAELQLHHHDHAGVGSLEDVVKILLESAGSVAQDDYSAEAINRKLVLAAYLSVYAERLDEAGAQRYRTTVEQVRRSAYQYLEQMPASQYPRVVNSAAWELSKISTSSDETANRRMLGSILAGHKPTYVHSLMVAELTRALLQRQIETRPETLVGLLGCRSAAEVQARREELCQTAYECGLYHDLGKCAVLMYIDNNARRLLDEEFFCIQSHPRTGADILNRMGCGRTLALAALYHHCYYNGKGGYPNDVPSCPPENKGIVDALSVADSLDAATDNIGRCYNLAKPFRTLLGELRAQSGTRYAPTVVALFEDERFCQQLAENTDAERKRVYLQVYHAGREEK